MSAIENPTKDKKGYFDPATKENVSYKELMSRCVVDKDTGVLLLPMEKGGTSTSLLISPKKSSRSSHSTQTEKPSLSDSSGKTKKRLKTSTAQIELVKTPIMSADDEDAPRKTDEERKHEISEIAVKLNEVHPTYQPITINLTTEDMSDRKSTSSSSSSSTSSQDEEDDETMTKRRKEKDEREKKSSSSEYTTVTTVVTTTESTTEKTLRKRYRSDTPDNSIFTSAVQKSSAQILKLHICL